MILTISNESIRLWMDSANSRFLHVWYTCEPRHEKTGFLHKNICENKDADQFRGKFPGNREADKLRGNHEADQRLCFRHTEN